MTATIFDRLSALADPTRARLLLVLEGQELTVGESCAVLQLPQSTVSRHLKVLADEGWVVSRADGTSRWYRLASALPEEAERLWGVVREQVTTAVDAEEDAARLRSVMAGRRSRSREFFSSAAGDWDGLRAELFGERPELAALPALLDAGWTVGDLGCGTGPLAASLAPFVRRVVAVDESEAMLAAARARLSALGAGNVELRSGALEELPVAEGELDAAVLSLVLPYTPEPAQVLAEAVRALRTGGRLLVVDLMPHGREEYRDRMGHVWLGFAAGPMSRWLEEAGLAEVRYIPLAPDPRARGPRLFAAVGRKV
jgi:ArsR family transcriptional regulator